MFAGAIGAFTGVRGLGIALICGGLIALVAFKVRKKDGIIPFGPMLAIGGIPGVLLSILMRN